MSDPKLRPIVNGDGEFEVDAETGALKLSAHPIYKARMRLGLPQGAWLYAPTEGHTLSRYRREKQTNASMQAFQKDLAFDLQKYGPDVTDILVARGAVGFELTISNEVLSG